MNNKVWCVIRSNYKGHNELKNIGPMGGSVNFTVSLTPSLSEDNYSIKRIIDIDPLGVWYNYGQETIGTFAVTEALSEAGIDLETTGEVNPSIQTITTPSSSGGGGGSTTTIIREKTIVLNSPSSSGSEEVSGDGEGSNEGEEEGKRAGITGGVIGVGKNILSGWSFVIILMVVEGFILVTVFRKFARSKDDEDEGKSFY